MKKSLFKKIYKEELFKISEKMDKRHIFYKKLEEFRIKSGYIPKEYLMHWTSFISDGKKYWKKVPSILKKIKKTARISATNRIKNEKNV